MPCRFLEAPVIGLRREPWKCFDACTRVLLAFPLCVPGTAFYRCMQEQLGARRNNPELESVDFFDLVIHELHKPDSELNENIVLDLLFLMLFASHETTFIGLTAILMFLTDDPKALQELMAPYLGPETPDRLAV
ncbi:unnamed protein product [Miscanthus lutarioriparius]|uniref:Cytochrome P450 n=1 Tax=Miscanthus lutarioriparius TaxID=422564 RepID=A0A811RUN9_9POAL|nr:unnamed protein product [Miscanthus lutarioriparius]